MFWIIIIIIIIIFNMRNDYVQIPTEFNFFFPPIYSKCNLP